MSAQSERLGVWLREVRESWGWTREDVSRHGGPGGSTQRRLEPKDDGTIPTDLPETVSRSVLHQYATAYGVPLEDLRAVQAGDNVPIPDGPPVARSPSMAHQPPSRDLYAEVNELRERIAVLEATLNRAIDRIEHRGH